MPEEIIIVFMVIVVPILCGTFIAMVAILKKGTSRKDAKLDADETRIMQQLYQSVSKLEDRIDSLETILAERERKKGLQK